MARPTYMPSRVKLYKKTNEEIKSVNKTFLEETGEVLMPQDMKKAQIYAGKKICFENEEITQIKTFDKPGRSSKHGFIYCSKKLNISCCDQLYKN